MSEARLQELFDSYDPSGEPPMPDGYVQGAVRQGRRRIGRHRVGVLGTSGVAAVAALAVGGGMVLGGGAAPGSGPASHRGVAAAPTTATPGSAQGLLHSASLAAYHRHVTVRPDQFIYVKSLMKTRAPAAGSDAPWLHTERTDGTFPKGVRTSIVKGRVQSWSSADGSRHGAGTGFGKGDPDQLHPTAVISDPSMASPTYEYLTTLPTDPDALMTKVRAAAQATADQKSGQQRLVDYFAFQTVCELINTGVLPSKLAGALYTVQSRLPGVKLVPHATDAAGRHGVAVAITDPINKTRHLMIFDKKTYRYLGDKIEEPGTGRYNSWSAMLQTGVVDKVGQLPQ